MIKKIGSIFVGALGLITNHTPIDHSQIGKITSKKYFYFTRKATNGD